MREKILAQIRAVRAQLQEANDHEERKALMEWLCILYAQLQATPE